MKIVHCCLSCFYIDGYSYQENELVREHIKDGHDVLVIASTESFNKDGRKDFVEAKSYIGQQGEAVIRLPYKWFIPRKIAYKLKAYKGFEVALTAFGPDVVMCHGLSFWDLLVLRKYKKKKPQVLIYADNHADKNNSAGHRISRIILHKLYYRAIIKRCLSAIERVLCISLESKRFCREIYDIPEEMLEFYPLGGQIFDDDEYTERRNKARRKYNINVDDILFLQTGKFDRKKKLESSLRAFLKTDNQRFKFFIGGTISSDERLIRQLIDSDDRIVFLGWQSAESLKNLLCAADIYLQPGSQSATMQMSLCARCPVILDDVESHHAFIGENGWLLNESVTLDKILKVINDQPLILDKLSQRSYEIARELLDYEVLAKRILRK